MKAAGTPSGCFFFGHAAFASPQRKVDDENDFSHVPNEEGLSAPVRPCASRCPPLQLLRYFMHSTHHSPASDCCFQAKMEEKMSLKRAACEGM